MANIRKDSVSNFAQGLKFVIKDLTQSEKQMIQQFKDKEKNVKSK